jgi:hypothetical protein
MTAYLIMWFILHPFHVGLTDITHNSETETYQVSIKLFTDDLEKGLEEFSGLKLDLVDSSFSDVSDSLISTYINQNFQIYTSTWLDLEYIGSEKEYDVTWIYLESDKTQIQEEIHVTNEILISVYSDQTHIVHCTIDGDIKSDLIHSKKTTVHFNSNK